MFVCVVICLFCVFLLILFLCHFDSLGVTKIDNEVHGSRVTGKYNVDKPLHSVSNGLRFDAASNFSPLLTEWRDLSTFYFNTDLWGNSFFTTKRNINTYFYSASAMLAMQSAVLAIVNPSVRPSVCPSVTRWHCVKTTHATIMGCSLQDSPMTPVSWRLISARNSKGNIGSEGAE